jgi:hypothetical protein
MGLRSSKFLAKVVTRRPGAMVAMIAMIRHLIITGIREVPMVHVGWSPSLINEMTHQQIGDMAA